MLAEVKNYIENILKYFGMEECKLISTPFDVNSKLCKIHGPHDYRTGK
jgi:hypothetical protein